MSLAVWAEGLGKRYAIATDRAAYGTLREALADFARSAWPGRRRGVPQQRRYLWALREVSFELAPGKALGIVGPNGAGKTTLLKILARITEPTEGRAIVGGRVGALLEVGTGFHPELTGRENIFLSGAILGMSRADIRARFDEIVEFAEVADFLDTPVKRYSSGMQMRLAFSVAAHFEPDILVVDEVLAVGDAEFQRRCLGKLHAVSTEGRTVLFVSHNMQAIRILCDRALQLRDGRIVRAGAPSEVVAGYLSTDLIDRVEVRWERDDSRPGDDRLRLVAVRLLDQLAQPRAVVSSSEPILIEMEVDVREPQPGLCIGFDLATADGVPVLRTYQTDGPEREWPQLRSGHNVLRCALPAGLLNGGRYTLSPRIGLHNVEWIVNSEPVLAFEVTLDHPRSPIWLTQRPGVVAPRLPWHAIASPVEGSAVQ